MAQKNATPTKGQRTSIVNAGLRAAAWVVIKELRERLIIKNRFTGEVRVIKK